MKPTYYRGERLADHSALWAYLPRLLIYPLHLAPLSAIALFATLFWIGVQSLASIAILVIVSPWLLAYVEAVIAHTSDGEAEPPRLGGEELFFSWASALRMMLLPVLLFGGWFHFHESQPELAMAVVLLGGLLVPAYLLLVSRFGLLVALNPLQLGWCIWGLGLPYLLVGALMAGSIGLVLQVGDGISVFGLILLILYLLLVNAHLLGFLAFHRAGRLGLDVRVAISGQEQLAWERQEAVTEKTLDLLAAALRRKDKDAAIAALERPIGPLIDLVAYHQNVFSGLALRPEKSVALDQGGRLLAVLLGDQQLGRALAVYRQCLDISRDFFPVRLEALPRLARHALAERQHALFEQMSLAALPYLEESAVAVELAYLRAVHLMDHHQDDAAALGVLRLMPPQAKRDPLWPRIEGLMRALEPRP